MYLADLLLLFVLLAILWVVLYRLYDWWARRRERRDDADLINEIENGLNKDKR